MSLLFSDDVATHGCLPLDSSRDAHTSRALYAHLVFSFAMFGFVVASFAAGALCVALLAGIFGAIGSVLLERRYSRRLGSAHDPAGRVAAFIGVCVGLHQLVPVIWVVESFFELLTKGATR